MPCKRQIAFLFFVALAVAAAVPVAEARSNTSLPGSVLVFPYFETGTVKTADLGTQPISNFEISVKCPAGSTCVDGTDVDIHVEWVCGVTSTFEPCQERNFILSTTVNGTVRFNTESAVCEPGPALQNLEGCGNVQFPPCEEGYVIAWVVDESGASIKYDALIGDAVIRNSPTAVTAYDAIPIQAGTTLATGASTDLKHDHQLHFDNNAYLQVTNQIIGSVELDNVNGAGFDQDQTRLVFLTLDVLSNTNNFPVDVGLKFNNEIEQESSDAFRFICWGETKSLNDQFGLNATSFGFPGVTGTTIPSPKALVVSTSAVKTPILGINDKSGRATLLGLIFTLECDPTATTCGDFADNHNELREFTYPFYYDNPTTTAFVPQ